MEPERAGGRQLAAVVVVSVALAVLAGGLAAIVGYGVGGGSGGGEFEDLGRALVAMVAAVVVGVPVLVASVVIGVRRTVVAGRRLATAAVVLAGVAAVPVLLGWATEASRRAGLDALGAVVAVVVVVAVAGAIGAAAGTVPLRSAITLVGVSVVALAIVAVALEVRGDEVADQRRVARYEANGAPLALIRGADLDAGFVGWHLQVVGGGHGRGEVTVQYRVVESAIDGYRYASLRLEADPEPIDCSDGSCQELGRRADGEPIVGRADASGRPGVTDVWVDLDRGRWRIEAVGVVDSRAAADVLEALEAVDAATFVAGTEEGFSP